MPFQVSPGINVTEIDLTTIVPAVSTTEGAVVGDFQWGPIHERTLIDGEAELIRTFWRPNNTQSIYEDWYTAWNFLAYGNKLWVVRVADTTSSNTAKNATCSNSSGFLVKNDTVYDENYADGSLQTSHTVGPWIARYAGEMGNSLKVSVCPSANAYESTLTGSVNCTANSKVVTGVGTTFSTEMVAGDLIVLNNETHRTKTITNTTHLTLHSTHTTGAVSNTSVLRRWEYYVETDQPPNTSTYASVRFGQNDEMHVVVIDEDGRWTGVNNDVLEVYQLVSKAGDAKAENGGSNYYKDQINNKSRYIKWASHSSTVINAGTDALNTSYGVPALPINNSLVGGVNGNTVGNDERLTGWDLFKSAEDVDVSLLLGSGANQTVATYVINNIAESRKDCIAILSAPRYTNVDNEDQEASAMITFRNTLPSTSYAVLDSGYKRQYDRYADVYRYVPLNGDIGGLMVRTDNTRDPWWSPAGFNRGHIKNVFDLAWNPRKADRDLLYKSGINAVITFPGQGTVLFGDKTLLAKPSAFDRINVRRLFIVLEKAISTASKFTLFEFNDEFTRSQFKNLVEPFLRDVQGRRGIFDFRVVCDETNNTPEVIDRNEFVGDIYIKPARSINFIQLNFIAVRTGVDFEEVVGQF